jgi:hypothetical protein
MRASTAHEMMCKQRLVANQIRGTLLAGECQPKTLSLQKGQKPWRTTWGKRGRKTNGRQCGDRLPGIAAEPPGAFRFGTRRISCIHDPLGHTSPPVRWWLRARDRQLFTRLGPRFRVVLPRGDRAVSPRVSGRPGVRGCVVRVCGAGHGVDLIWWSVEVRSASIMPPAHLLALYCLYRRRREAVRGPRGRRVRPLGDGSYDRKLQGEPRRRVRGLRRGSLGVPARTGVPVGLVWGRPGRP